MRTADSTPRLRRRRRRRPQIAPPARNAAAPSSDPELAGPTRSSGVLGTELKKLPDDTAARTAHAVATRLARDGKWAEAREVFGLLATQYPGHPLAIEAFRWLTSLPRQQRGPPAHRDSAEAAHQERVVRCAAERAGNASPPAARSNCTATPVVQEDRVPACTVPMRSCSGTSRASIWSRSWTAFGPVYSRDPAAWLCFLAARRQVGEHNDAITFIRDYFKNTPGAAAMPPGVDPWRDCLAAELWMTDRSLIAVQPKPLGICRHTEVRPLLDGKLDDACWQDVKPMPLAVVSRRPTKPDEVKAFGEAFKTEARFAYDDQFLYIAVSCSHPAGMKVEPVAKRTRDADMTGHDRVDILLDLDRDYQTYYRFQVDHRGCLAEDCWGDRTLEPEVLRRLPRDRHRLDGRDRDSAGGTDRRPAVARQDVGGERVAGRAGEGRASVEQPGRRHPAPEGMGLLQFRTDK